MPRLELATMREKYVNIYTIHIQGVCKNIETWVNTCNAINAISDL